MKTVTFINKSFLIISLIMLSSFIANANTESKLPLNNEVKEKAKKKKTKVYHWEVKSNYGYAKGVSFSEKEAKKMIQFMSNNDVVTYKIIESIKK